MAAKNSHCSSCGARLDDTSFPRRCPGCGALTYANPIPVAVVLIPVETGLLAVRRAIPPRVGALALPGGYINLGETWQEAGAREVQEETGIVIAAANIRDFRVRSAPDGNLLIFGLAPGLPSLPILAANAEVSELVVVDGGTALAFPLHAEIVREYCSLTPAAQL